MTTTTQRPCRAKNPATCSYHVTASRLEKAIEKALAAKDFTAYEEARSTLDSVHNAGDAIELINERLSKEGNGTYYHYDDRSRASIAEREDLISGLFPSGVQSVNDGFGVRSAYAWGDDGKLRVTLTYEAQEDPESGVWGAAGDPDSLGIEDYEDLSRSEIEDRASEIATSLNEEASRNIWQENESVFEATDVHEEEFVDDLTTNLYGEDATDEQRAGIASMVEFTTVKEPFSLFDDADVIAAWESRQTE